MMTVWVQGLTAVFLTPAIVAGTIAEDRQRKVLDYLLASPLSGAEIVLGKLLVRLLYLVILVMVGFPVMSLALLFGGVDPIMLALTEAAVLSIIFFLGSASMWASSRLQKPRDAILFTYGVVVVWLMLPVIRYLVANKLVPYAPLIFEPLESFLSAIELSAPSGILDAVARQARSGANVPVDLAFWLVGLNLLFGLALLAPTVLGLRRRERNEGKGGKGWIFGGRNRERGWLRHRSFSLDDPMLWKECPGRYRFRSPTLRLLLTILKLAVAGLLGYWMIVSALPAFEEVLQHGYGEHSSNWDSRYGFNLGVRSVTVIGYLLLVLILASVSAGCITSEKEKDSWISLITTPMDGWEILRGKVAGAFWSARYLFAGLLILWTTGVVAGSLHPFGFVLLAGATTVYSAFAVALGVHFSSICRTSTRSLVATFATLLFLNGGYMLCCMPAFITSGADFLGVLLVSGMTYYIEGAAACSYQDVAQFFGASGSFIGEYRMHVIFTYLLSVAGYGVAAFLLFQHRIARFDEDVERPRRNFLSNRFPKPDPSGTEFLNSDEAGEAIDMDQVEETPVDPDDAGSDR
jgi:ABC-type transport system involved in multi-copper enzyme maturation permease subunit